jgi:hypothetical protein
MGRGGNNLLYSNALFTEKAKIIPGQTSIAGLKARRIHYMKSRAWDLYNSPMINDPQQLGENNFCDGFNFAKRLPGSDSGLLNVEKFISTNNWLAFKETLSYDIKWRSVFVYRPLKKEINNWVTFLTDTFQESKPKQGGKVPYQLIPVAFTFTKQEDTEDNIVVAYPYKQDSVKLEQILPEQKLTKDKQYHSNRKKYPGYHLENDGNDPENDFFHPELEKRSAFLSLSALASVEDMIQQKNAKWYWAPDLSLSTNRPVLPSFPGFKADQSLSTPVYNNNHTLLYLSSRGRLLGAVWTSHKNNIKQQQQQIKARIPFIPEKRSRN